MSIKWTNIRPYPREAYFDLCVILSAIHQIPVIHDKNDHAERSRFQIENEFKATPDNDQ